MVSSHPLLFALCLPLFLSACLPGTPDGPLPPADLDNTNACGAAEMQDLVGQPFSALAAMTFAQPMRLIRPDMAVTMDYSAERLNIVLDEADRIASVTCG